MASETTETAQPTSDAPVPPQPVSDPPAPPPPSATPVPPPASEVAPAAGTAVAVAPTERPAPIRPLDPTIIAAKMAIGLTTPKSLFEAAEMANSLMYSTLLPKAFFGKDWTLASVKSDVIFLLMFGAQWNLPVFTSLQIHIIDGKPSLPALFVVGLIQASPLCLYFDEVERTDTSATWETQRLLRNGMPGPVRRATFTKKEAEDLKFYEKANNQWNRQGPNMMSWRAATRLGRMVYAELLMGLHVTEELVDAIDVGGPDIETIRTARAEVDRSRNGNPIPLMVGPPKSDNAIPDPHPALREPEPAARQGVAARVREKATKARGERDAPPADLFAPGGEVACDRCGGPIAPADAPTCKPCLNG